MCRVFGAVESVVSHGDDRERARSPTPTCIFIPWSPRESAIEVIESNSENPRDYRGFSP